MIQEGQCAANRMKKDKIRIWEKCIKSLFDELLIIIQKYTDKQTNMTWHGCHSPG
jgi:hypothetical protein